MAIVVVSGMEAEARIARRAGLRAIVAAGTPARRRERVDGAIRDGATALLSFGIAGALDPALRPGALVVAKRVVTETGATFACDPPGLALLPEGTAGADIVLGGDTIAADARTKHALFERTAAAAIDLESGFVAQAGAAAGIPFWVLRAVADPAWRDLPAAAAVGLDAEGRPALGAVLGSLAASPGQLPGLIAVALETRMALAALRRAVQVFAAVRRSGHVDVVRI